MAVRTFFRPASSFVPSRADSSHRGATTLGLLLKCGKLWHVALRQIRFRSCHSRGLGGRIRNEPIFSANIQQTKRYFLCETNPFATHIRPERNRVAHLPQTRYSLGYMKTSNGLWRECLQGQLPQPLASELDKFESEVLLKKAGKMDDKIFAETRLRRGSYGQRYDNGQRHDGKETQKLSYPTDNTKGPGTLWDAPGMQRIKIPYGGMNASQLEILAQLAEEYSDGIAHVTTRQDIQLHFIHIEDTPAIMRRLASVGITTREACGNSLRNVTGCPIAGVCREQTFDVTPYAKAIAYFMLGHPDAQSFGRKFKIAFS